jgi:hypothetical protein
MRVHATAATAVLLLAALTACGGGGDDMADKPTASASPDSGKGNIAPEKTLALGAAAQTTGDGGGDVGEGASELDCAVGGVLLGVGFVLLGAGLKRSWVQATVPTRNAATNRAVMAGRLTGLLGLWVRFLVAAHTGTLAALPGRPFDLPPGGGSLVVPPPDGGMCRSGRPLPMPSRRPASQPRLAAAIL